MVEKKGRFIVIEGIDGAGKETQAKLLISRFESGGREVMMDDYPHYETGFWGEHVGKMLRGDFGDPFQVSPYLTLLPYILDQSQGSDQIRDFIRRGGVVVSNRFYTTNYAHQAAKLPEEERDQFRSWLEEAGYGRGNMHIVRPDLVIALLVDPPICQQMLKTKAKRKYTGEEALDLAEKNFKHQMAAAREYEKMVIANSTTWTKVDCCQNGVVLSPEEIHEMVWKEIQYRGLV